MSLVRIFNFRIDPMKYKKRGFGAASRNNILVSGITVMTEGVPVFFSILFEPINSLLFSLEEMFREFFFSNVGHFSDLRARSSVQLIKVFRVPCRRISRKLCSKIVIDVPFPLLSNPFPCHSISY